MEKALILILILVMIGVGLVLFMTQRYQAVETGAQDLIIFDRIKCSFIEKNAKGEWEEQSVKAGEISMEFPETVKEKPEINAPVKTQKPTKPKPRPKLEI